MSSKPTVRYAADNECPDNMWEGRESLAYQFYNNTFKPGELPNRIQVPLYVNYIINEGRLEVQDTSIYIDNGSNGKDARMNLARLVVELPIPDVQYDECLARVVEALKAEREAILAKAQMEAMRIDDKIQDLLAITYQPETEEATDHEGV